jgi:translation elongation factor EF-G
MKDKKETTQILRDHGWEPDVAKKVMRFDSRGNVMINGTKGVQFVDESTDSLLSGFDDLINEGGLAKEQVRNCKFTFTHFVPHEAVETFDISEKMRGQTAGKAIWNSHFKAWTPVPKSIGATLLQEIRKRKGLSPEPPQASEFIDKE